MFCDPTEEFCDVPWLRMPSLRSLSLWLRMPSLRSLSLHSGRYAFDSQLLQVVNCTAIKELNFDQVRPASADSAMYFATLMHILAKERPDVACYWDWVRMSDVWEEG